MKKFAINFTVVLFSVIICTYFILFSRLPKFYKYSENFEVYTTNGSVGKIIQNVNLKNFIFLDGIKGQAFSVDENFDLNAFLSNFNASLKVIESLAVGESFYFYSAKLGNFVTIDGERVNLHVFRGENGYKIGTPIIFGSF